MSPFSRWQIAALAALVSCGLLQANLADGTELPVTRETVAGEPERALRLLSAATVALAVALVLVRVT